MNNDTMKLNIKIKDEKMAWMLRAMAQGKH